MYEFNVYKDIALFLRKVFLRSLYEKKYVSKTGEPQVDTEDQNALDILNSLLEENEDSPGLDYHNRRSRDLRIHSKKMPPHSKSKWLNLYLEMVQFDLGSIEWTQKGIDNLSREERKVLKELGEAKHIVIKRSDKGVNVVLMDENSYEGEAKRLLNDLTLYQRLPRCGSTTKSRTKKCMGGWPSE